MSGVVPPCRKCGRTADVFVFWSDRPADTICHVCCPSTHHSDGETGHVFSRIDDQMSCEHCGIARKDTDHEITGDDE